MIVSKPLRHTHADDRLTAGCEACVQCVRDDQEAARWESAPLRKVTWRCSYLWWDDGCEISDEVSFTLTVRVPADASGDEVDERYADQTGEAFELALPSEVPIFMTDVAAETMHVKRVTIGAVVPEEAPEPAPQPTLFGGEG